VRLTSLACRDGGDSNADFPDNLHCRCVLPGNSSATAARSPVDGGENALRPTGSANSTGSNSQPLRLPCSSWRAALEAHGRSSIFPGPGERTGRPRSRSEPGVLPRARPAAIGPGRVRSKNSVGDRVVAAGRNSGEGRFPRGAARGAGRTSAGRTDGNRGRQNPLGGRNGECRDSPDSSQRDRDTSQNSDADPREGIHFTPADASFTLVAARLHWRARGRRLGRPQNALRRKTLKLRPPHVRVGVRLHLERARERTTLSPARKVCCPLRSRGPATKRWRAPRRSSQH
jgi:hypothetical protein